MQRPALDGNSTPFAQDALETKLAPLETLPTSTRLPSLTQGFGPPLTRIEAVQTLIDALAQGELPHRGDNARNTWLQHVAVTDLLQTIGNLQLTKFATERADVAEQVAKSLLWHLDQIATYRDRFNDSEAEAVERARAAFRDDWVNTQADWEQVYRVFDSLGGLNLALEASDIQGLLTRPGWAAVERVHAMIEALPELKAVIQKLGRARPSSRTTAQAPVWTVVEETGETQSFVPAPFAIDHPGADIDSIQRGNDLAAMLPAEALLRHRPALKRLWQARFAEAQLITYRRRVEIDAPVPVPTLMTRSRRVLQPPPEQERGPIIVCVDTSSSMQGGKEWLVKACVFEALRTAHQHKRACYLYAFSDAQSIVEHQLSLTRDGLHALIDFLEMSFQGGTDIEEPIHRAIARVALEDWVNADVLIASDGEFGLTRDTLAKLDEAKGQLHLRVQGILAGDRETRGLLQVCDDVLWLREWRRFEAAAGQIDSPVHTKSLTKLYFPGAVGQGRL